MEFNEKNEAIRKERENFWNTKKERKKEKEKIVTDFIDFLIEEFGYNY